MNKLQEKINKIPKQYFSLQDLYKFSNTNKASLKVALSRAVRDKQVIRLASGLYAKDINNIPWENLAVNIYRPSYISFESALNHYNILSQQSAYITLATTKRRNDININDQVIIYRHIKDDLFWGYIKKDDYLIAEPEKAFLDLAYLSLNGYAHFDPAEMNLGLLDKKKIKSYLKKFNNTKLDNLMKKTLFN
jgi:predicted transcriptional regulator of viral defense system